MNHGLNRRKFLGIGAFSVWAFPYGWSLLTAKEADHLFARFLLNYANILHAGYKDSLAGVENLQMMIGKFLESPSESGLQAARKAWGEARIPYLQTEVGRFFDGPIDGLEGFINSWPIDENYIDYTESEPNAGIINQVSEYPVITPKLLLSLNEKEGEKNISTGWHAIEFLLWGQDLSAEGPGNRSFKDYVEPSSGGHPNALRRRTYLKVVVELLREQLSAILVQWQPGRTENYRAHFLTASPRESLEKIIRGMGSFSGAELGGERTVVAYTTKEQEDEHSCFSDTTHQDMRFDQIGIINICRGAYHQTDGKIIRGESLLDVIQTKDMKLAQKLDAQLSESLKAIEAVPVPFDQAIKGRDSTPGRVALKKAIDALQAQTKTMAYAAQSLGIKLNLK